MLINRNIFSKKILKFINNEQIKIITGVRRCGKSFLLGILADKLIESGVDDSHIIKILMEDYEFDALTATDICYQYIKERMIDDDKYYILIDEVQNIDKWEKVINSLRLKNTDIYITGSNSKVLGGELATLLSGRYIEFKLYTASFLETYEYLNQTSGPIDAKTCFRDYVMFGGYPLAIITGYSEDLTRPIVADIYNSTVYKDVIIRSGIKDESLLLRIIDFVIDNVGNLFSIKKVADYINSQGYKTNSQTVGNYIKELEKAFVVEKAPRYDVKGKELLANTEKYYVADHSLMYVRKGYSLEYIGQVLENIVFNEIRRRGYKAYVGKIGEKEVDFIAEKEGEKVYIQVAYSIGSEETMDRETKSLFAIRDSYPKYVVTMDTLAGGNKDGIRFMHIADFLIKKEWL